MKDKVINVRVSKEFKQEIADAIKDRQGYTITRVLLEGAKIIVDKLNKEKQA